MPVSSYQADLVVEIAFDGGFRIPMADWTWTDVSDYVELDEGIDISGGRSDEKSVADANQLKLTLDNRDGRFTAGKTGGAYYPDVVLYKPIRVTADPVDGALSERFVGYINTLPVEWDGTDAYSYVTVTASSRLARLGLNAAWRSLVEQTFLADAPVVYHPLGEPEEATLAADVSGYGSPSLTMAGTGTDVVFGQATGPPTDDLTAATFAGGKYLTGVVPTVPGVTGITVNAVECFFLRTGSPTVVESVLEVGYTGVSGYVVHIRTDGKLDVGGGVLSSGSVADGSTHHVLISNTAGTTTVYLDGVSIGTQAAVTAVTGHTILVGGAGDPATASLTGVVSHVALYQTDVSAARAAAHATAGSTGFAGELTSDRLERYGEMAGISLAEIDAETGSVTMSHVDTTGSNVVDMLRLVERTEGGVLFDGRDGVLTMHNRSHRYASSSAFTLNMLEHEVEADYSPRLDASMLTNDVTVTSQVTTAHKVDTDSIAAYGHATASVDIADDHPDAPLQYASWAVYLFAEPKVRTPNLSVDALAQVGKTPNCAAVLAATVGDKVTVSNQPTQAQASSVDYFIEGWTESWGPESCVITWNVTPSSPDDTVLILGDATRGEIGIDPLAF